MSTKRDSQLEAHASMRLSDEATTGAVIAINAILRRAWTEEGVAMWWDHGRRELNGKTPREIVAHDPEAVVRLALDSLEMTVT